MGRSPHRIQSLHTPTAQTANGNSKSKAPNIKQAPSNKQQNFNKLQTRNTQPAYREVCELRREAHDDEFRLGFGSWDLVLV
jgi:hypothetical protein